jgi:hypothetical protein
MYSSKRIGRGEPPWLRFACRTPPSAPVSAGQRSRARQLISTHASSTNRELRGILGNDLVPAKRIFRTSAPPLLSAPPCRCPFASARKRGLAPRNNIPPPHRVRQNPGETERPCAGSTPSHAPSTVHRACEKEPCPRISRIDTNAELIRGDSCDSWAIRSVARAVRRCPPALSGCRRSPARAFALHSRGRFCRRDIAPAPGGFARRTRRGGSG